MRSLQDQVAFRGTSGQVVGQLAGGGQRLLDENVLAGLERLRRQGIVRVNRRRDDHQFYRGVGEHPLDVGGCAHRWLATSVGLQPLPIEIADPMDLRVRVVSEDPQQIRPPVAETDHGDADGARRRIQ